MATQNKKSNVKKNSIKILSSIHFNWSILRTTYEEKNFPVLL